MSAGGGASSSKAGGLNDGVRSMCMGRCWRAFAEDAIPLICAVGGRGSVGLVKGPGWGIGALLFAAFMAFMAG